MIAAVPYATTSVMAWPSSEESKRIITTALAPMARVLDHAVDRVAPRVLDQPRVLEDLATAE